MKVQDCKRSSLLPRFGRLVAVGMMAVALLSPTGAQAAEVSLFYEDFESNDLVQWSDVQYWNVVGVGGGSDGKKARGVGNESGSATLLANISTVGYSQLRLSFRYRANGFESGDVASIRTLKNFDSTWEEFGLLVGDSDGWQEMFFYLPEDYGNQADFHIGFMLTANAADDNFDVDNVLLVGHPIVGDEDSAPTPTPTLTPTPTPTPAPVATPVATVVLSPALGATTTNGDASDSQSTKGLTLASTDTKAVPLGESALPNTGGRGFAWLGGLGMAVGLLGLWGRRQGWF